MHFHIIFTMIFFKWDKTQKMCKRWSKMNFIYLCFLNLRHIIRQISFKLICICMLKGWKKHYFKSRELEYIALMTLESWTTSRTMSCLWFFKGGIEIWTWENCFSEMVKTPFRISPILAQLPQDIEKDRKWWRILEQWLLAIFNTFIVGLLVLVSMAWES